MSRWLGVALLAWGCSGKDAQKNDSAGEDPATGAGTSIPDSDTTTDTTSSTGSNTAILPGPFTLPQPPPLIDLSGYPPFNCRTVDTAAVETCTSGGFHALYNEVGYPTVAEALSASSAGETIRVCPGIWNESVSLSEGRALVAVDPTAGVTGLSANERIVEVTDGGTIAGLSLTGSSLEAVFHNSGALVIECSEISNNEFYSYTASGIVSFGDLVLLRNDTFRANRGYQGGALYMYNIDVHIENCTFEGNESELDGGAIQSQNHGRFEIWSSTFTGNTSARGGALSFVNTADSSLFIDDSLFSGNNAWGDGGGGLTFFSAEGDNSLYIRGTSFDSNSSTSGGGMYVSSLTGAPLDVVIDGGSFTSNEADDAAAISFDSWTPDASGTLVLSGILFEDNVASGRGAVLGAATTDTFEIFAADLTALRNDGGADAVLWLAGQSMECTNCDFGTGADDNIPADAFSSGDVYETLGLNFVL